MVDRGQISNVLLVLYVLCVAPVLSVDVSREQRQHRFSGFLSSGDTAFSEGRLVKVVSTTTSAGGTISWQRE